MSPRSSPRSAMQLLAALLCCCGWLAEAEGFVVRRSAGGPPDDTCESLGRFLAQGGGSSTGIGVQRGDVGHGQSGSICGGHCCNNATEEHLRQQAKEDFHTQIHHHSRSLLGLLATTADSLRDTVALLARQSENKTLTLFSQVYRGMSTQSKPSVLGLYQAMIDYVAVPNTAESLQQPLSQDSLQDRFTEFFARLFPVAYHQAVSPTHQQQPVLQQDFTEKFKGCLHKMMDEIEPFDSIPKQIGLAMGKSLEATRVLIQALTLGKSVLENSDRLMFSVSGPQQEACYKALLRMTHCPKCRGVPHDVMPCRGFCTNVMRGCLTEAASELDFAWSEYVETVERLVMALDGHNDDPLALNVENAFRQLDSRISDAVMLAMEKGPVLEEKVRKVCGRAEVDSPGGPAQLVLPASLTSSSSSSSFTGTRGSGPGPGLSLAALQQLPPVTTPSPSRAPGQLHAQLGNFLASVASSRSFYGNLADAMCDEYPERACWNGERVAEYAKTVVDSSYISQKYNPEFTFLASNSDGENKGYLNANTNVINDQLRRINQLVQSQLMSAPDMASVLLADEAFEGSGSGDRPLWGRRPGPEAPDDTDDDNSADDERDDAEASGSGMGPSDNDRNQPNNGGNAETKDAGGAACITSSLLLLLFAPSLLLLLEAQRLGLA